MLWLSYIQNGEWSLFAAMLFWIIVSITLHELGHGVAALWQGDGTPREMGHMTLNPLVHMGPWSLLMLLLVGFAWGLMPVNPSRFRWGRQGRVVVAGAGPAVNFLLAFVTLTTFAVLLVTLPPQDELTQGQRNLLQFCFVGGSVNVMLGIFNLLPLPPLDGSDILSGFSAAAYRFFHNPTVVAAAPFILIVVLFSGIARVFIRGGQTLAMDYVQWVAGWVRTLST
jgi:Zn-dependent protease